MKSFTVDNRDFGSGSIEAAKANEDNDDDGGEDDEDEDEDGDPGLVPLPPGLVCLQALPSHQTHARLQLILKSMMMVVLVMIPMIFASCFLFFSKMFQNDDHPNPKLLAVPGSNMIEINPAVCSTATPAT